MSDRSRRAPAPGDLPRLVLASGSPRRLELLRELGVVPEVRPPAVDETPRPDESATDYVRRLADEKATAAAGPGELVLAADTIVVEDGDLLGKPEGPAAARAMLRRLADREHRVLTGVALVDSDRRRSAAALAISRVRIAELSDEEIAWYVDTGEPLDKAGAYAIQGLGSLFVESVEGNYSNVVGLPLPATYRLFRELGYDLRDWRQP